MRATKAIIHLDNLQYNIQQIRQRLDVRTKICLPVKADAYGHGAVRTAIAAIRAGVSYLAVASIQEGIELREAGIVAPIISLSLPILEEIDSIIEYDIEPLVIDEAFINELNRTAESRKKTVAVHLKIDTGMSKSDVNPPKLLNLQHRLSDPRTCGCKGLPLILLLPIQKRKMTARLLKHSLNALPLLLMQSKKRASPYRSYTQQTQVQYKVLLKRNAPWYDPAY